MADYLNLGDYRVREDEICSYLSALNGDGFIPVLSFHKLGHKNEFELEKELFEQLLIYLNNHNFHVISDRQYLDQDYSYAENGEKIIVLGSDDGARGVFYFETEGDLKYSSFRTVQEKHVISSESMVYYLDKHLEKENGKGNFTFYLTFDAIPFRQTGGWPNPGTPYLQMPAVKEKLDYLSSNYIIGNHTAHHFYCENLNETEFTNELIEFYEIMEDYSIDISSIDTLAYSFGIGDLQKEREQTVSTFNYKGVTLRGAFDYDGYLSYPLSSPLINRFDVPRIGVDNKSFQKIMTLLENTDIFTSRRVVLIEAEKYPFEISELDLSIHDSNYILIRD